MVLTDNNEKICGAFHGFVKIMRESCDEVGREKRIENFKILPKKTFFLSTK